MQSRESYRLRLRVALKLLALTGVIGFGLLLLSALFSRPGESIALPYAVDLSGLGSGALVELHWNGRRVLILHRDPAMLAGLPPADALYDPNSRLERLPTGLDRGLRSYHPQWLVVYGESTDLGCPVDLAPEPADQAWAGGFQDRCRKGRYDYAGRVLRDQPARRNLEIPRHRIEGTTLTLLPQ